MKKIILGTVAEKGAGKGLFARIVQKLLPEKRVVLLRTSDTWREILGILNLEISRQNLTTLATALRAGFQDEGILNRVVEKRIAEQNADIVIVDGIRKTEEAEFVKQKGGILVSITAPAEIRFRRRREHVENIDEKNISWGDFLAQQNAPTETEIRAIGETMADAIIDNSGTVEEFEEKIQEFLRRYGIA